MASIRPAWIAAILFCLAPGAAGCAAGPSTGGEPSTAPARSTGPAMAPRALAAKYLAIAEPANHRLDIEVDAYADNAHHDLAAARKALRAEAATERQFDRSLAAISFPRAIETTARALIRVNEIRARLALRQAAAPSIRALLSFTATHNAADAEVEAQVRVIRRQLGLPPPETS